MGQLSQDNSKRALTDQRGRWERGESRSGEEQSLQQDVQIFNHLSVPRPGPHSAIWSDASEEVEGKELTMEEGRGENEPLANASGVQPVAGGPHAAQDGCEYGPTQNCKFT